MDWDWEWIDGLELDSLIGLGLDRWIGIWDEIDKLGWDPWIGLGLDRDGINGLGWHWIHGSGWDPWVGAGMGSVDLGWLF